MNKYMYKFNCVFVYTSSMKNIQITEKQYLKMHVTTQATASLFLAHFYILN